MWAHASLQWLWPAMVSIPLPRSGLDTIPKMYCITETVWYSQCYHNKILYIYSWPIKNTLKSEGHRKSFSVEKTSSFALTLASPKLKEKVVTMPQTMTHFQNGIIQIWDGFIWLTHLLANLTKQYERYGVDTWRTLRPHYHIIRR